MTHNLRDFRKKFTDKIRLKSKTTKDAKKCEQRSRLQHKGKEVILCVQGFRKLGQESQSKGQPGEEKRTSNLLSIFVEYNIYNLHMIVTMKIDSVQVTSVRKVSLTLYDHDSCHSGHRKVSVVRLLVQIVFTHAVRSSANFLKEKKVFFT